MADDKTTEKESFADWEKRKHAEYQENMAAYNERVLSRMEARRETAKVIVELMKELPATLKGYAEILGEVPTVRIGVEGVTIIPRGDGIGGLFGKGK